MNGLLAFTWALLTHLGMCPNFEWVPSALNVSDAVSRGDFSEALKAGWTRLHFDLNPLITLFLRVAEDLQYATGDAISDCLDLVASL